MGWTHHILRSGHQSPGCAAAPVDVTAHLCFMSTMVISSPFWCKVVVKDLLQYGTIKAIKYSTRFELCDPFSCQDRIILSGGRFVPVGPLDLAPEHCYTSLVCGRHFILPGKYFPALHLSEKGMTSSGRVTSAQVVHMTRVVVSSSPGQVGRWGFGEQGELGQGDLYERICAFFRAASPPDVVCFNGFPKHFSKLMEGGIMEIFFQVNSEYLMSRCVLNVEGIKAIRRITHRIVLNGLENATLPLSRVDVYHYFSNFNHQRKSFARAKGLSTVAHGTSL